jgi:hypothetical protein
MNYTQFILTIYNRCGLTTPPGKQDTAGGLYNLLEQLTVLKPIIKRKAKSQII